MPERVERIRVTPADLRPGDVFAQSYRPGFYIREEYQHGDRVRWAIPSGRDVRVSVIRDGDFVTFNIANEIRPTINRVVAYEPSSEDQENRAHEEALDPGNRTGWER